MSTVSPRRSRRAARPSKGDRKEQALVATASRLLAEGRFADVSVAELARKAGLQRESFYFYFASKPALLATVVSTAVADFNRRLTAGVSENRSRTPAQMVAATVEAAADLWWEHRAAMVAGVELGVTFPDFYDQSMADVAIVRAPTVELLRLHGSVPEAGNPQAADDLITALILMSERNFYDIARREAPRAEYDAMAKLLTRVWQRAFGVGVD